MAFASAKLRESIRDLKLTSVGIYNLAVFSLCVLVASTGCEHNSNSTSKAGEENVASSNSVDSKDDQDPVSSSATEDDAASEGSPPISMTQATWDQVTKLYNQAKQSGQTSANTASQWLQDVWESTSASGVDISKQSQEWLSAQYLRAKDAGTTSANSASQYFQSEFAKLGTWEYQMLTQKSTQDDSITVTNMNQLGSERWECFAVTNNDGTQRIYFRRKVKTDFDNIPTRDLMRILMALAGGGLVGSGDSP